MGYLELVHCFLSLSIIYFSLSPSFLFDIETVLYRMIECEYMILVGNVQKEGKDIKDCAREVEECAGLRNAYAVCKRGQLDPRTRIRGNKGY